MAQQLWEMLDKRDADSEKIEKWCREADERGQLLETQYQTCMSDVKKLDKDLSTVKQSREAQQKEIEQLKRDLAQDKQKLESIETEKKQTEARIASRNQSLEEAIDSQRGVDREHIASCIKRFKVEGDALDEIAENVTLRLNLPKTEKGRKKLSEVLDLTTWSAMYTLFDTETVLVLSKNPV